MFNDSETIRRIKLACDAGFTVTLQRSPAYTVIKDSVGQYLIAYRDGQSDANYIGLHGKEGTDYENTINMSGPWLVNGQIL